MLKVKQNSKKKPSSVKAAHAEAQTQKSTPKPRPGWNDSSNDMNQYKLSQAELIQKKVSLMSKNRTEAREFWLKRQDKLQKGVIDEDTLSVLETCSKKPPEKNLKNNTYFVRAEQLDLKSEASKLEVTDISSSIQPKEEECGLINKIDRDLKETRDFIQKFDKYSHVTKTEVDPAKLLVVHQNIKSKSYESNAEQVTRRPPSKQKTSAQKAGPKASENQNSVSKKRSEENLEVENADKENNLDDSFEKIKKIAHKDDDIACYFSSLNKIEDTIKFLEQNIIGAEQKQKEIKKDEPGLKGSLGHQTNTVTRKPFEPIDINKFFDGSPVRNESVQQSEKKCTGPTGFLSDGKVHFDLENFDTVPKGKGFGSENQVAEDNYDEEQISFSLTMRSGDFDQENENRRGTERGSAVVRPSVQNEPSARNENYYGVHQNSRVEFDEIAITKEKPKMTKQSAPKFSEEFEQENENKENEFFYDENEEIERIKQMLKATQEDIQKMSSVVFEFPGQTVKRSQGVAQGSEISSNRVNVTPYNESVRGYTSVPSQSSFYTESSMERNLMKEPSITIKPQQLSNLLKNAEKLPLQDITGQFSGGEEEVPKPVAVRSRPTPMSHPNYERNSLSIRANLR